MSDTDISTAAVERLLDGVTAGPWHDFGGENGAISSEYGLPVSFYASRDNRRFIAASRDLVPAMLADRDLIAQDRDRLAAEVERLQKEVTETNLGWEKTSLILGMKNAEIARLKLAVDAAAKIGHIVGFLGDDEGRIEAFREACGPDLIAQFHAALTPHAARQEGEA